MAVCKNVQSGQVFFVCNKAEHPIAQRKENVLGYSYPGDTRSEFKMWGGASKSVFVLVLKICQH